MAGGNGFGLTLKLFQAEVSVGHLKESAGHLPTIILTVDRCERRFQMLLNPQALLAFSIFLLHGTFFFTSFCFYIMDLAIIQQVREKVFVIRSGFGIGTDKQWVPAKVGSEKVLLPVIMEGSKINNHNQNLYCMLSCMSDNTFFDSW